MARLGELLIAAKLLEPEKLEQALRAQVVYGARLGTNLVELHHIDLDNLARALGRQHGLPAALARHFDKADPELQAKLPVEIARQYSVVPLLRVGAERKIAVASLDPLDGIACGAIASALGITSDQLVVSIAGELRVRYHLERVYHLLRTARFLRSRGKTAPPPVFGDVPVEPQSDPDVQLPLEPPTPTITRTVTPVRAKDAEDLAALIEQAVATATTPAPAPQPPGRDRRTYVRTIEEDAVIPSTLGRIAVRRVPVGVSEEPRLGATLPEATRAIKRAPNRDRVAELVMDAIERFVPGCTSAMLMVPRGDVAIGWKAFSRVGGLPNELAVPMDAGMVPEATHHNVTARTSSARAHNIDRLLLRALGNEAADLAVVPVAVTGTVLCVIATALDASSPAAELEAIAAAAGSAFGRLIRDASR